MAALRCIFFTRVRSARTTRSRFYCDRKATARCTVWCGVVSGEFRARGRFLEQCSEIGRSHRPRCSLSGLSWADESSAQDAYNPLSVLRDNLLLSPLWIHMNLITIWQLDLFIYLFNTSVFVACIPQILQNDTSRPKMAGVQFKFNLILFVFIAYLRCILPKIKPWNYSIH